MLQIQDTGSFPTLPILHSQTVFASQTTATFALCLAVHVETFPRAKKKVQKSCAPPVPSATTVWSLKQLALTQTKSQNKGDESESSRLCPFACLPKHEHCDTFLLGLFCRVWGYKKTQLF